MSFSFDEEEERRWDREAGVQRSAGVFDHVTPEGLQPTDRALEAGFCHKYIGENLAAGQQTVTRVMEAWDESPAHRRNLAEPDFVYVGIGYYQDSTGRRFWAQLFAFDYNE